MRMSAQGEALEAEPASRDSRSFVIVYPGYHRQWATWIHRVLERLGCQVVLQRWGPPREQPLEEALEDLLLADGEVLLVLSEWFFELGPRKEGEWDAVMRGFVAAHRDRFAAVNVTSPALPTSAAVVRPVELWGVNADEAVRRLLNRLEVEAQPPQMIEARSGHRYPRDTPDIWGEVPRRNSDFTGRDDLLNSLQQRLMDAERGTAAVALVGMPGIGKPQSHRNTPTASVPTTTSCGGSTPTPAARCASGSVSSPRAWASPSTRAAPVDVSVRSGRRCGAASRTAAG